MARFSEWCIIQSFALGNHKLSLLEGEPANHELGITATAAVIPSHYTDDQQISRAFARLGKSAAAALIETMLPTRQTIRSGDLGEIYATEWIREHSGGYSAPINRLRWKDHRDMPMHGDDVIAILSDQRSGRIRFMKVEAKSRGKLTPDVLRDARIQLDKDNGLPSPHGLAFISARLKEIGTFPLADAIDAALLKHGISRQDVCHLLFVFSENAQHDLLTNSLQAYHGKITQWGVGLRLAGHQAFIGAVYERVISNAKNG